MKRIIVILVVLLFTAVSSSAFAGGKYGWRWIVSSIYKGKHVAVDVCAIGEYDAGLKARKAGLCGIPPTRHPYPSVFLVCVEHARSTKTNTPCTIP